MALSATLGELDGPALRAGGLAAAAIAIPAGVIAQLLDDGDDGGGLVALFGVLALAGLVLGASVTARRQTRGTPITHGMVAATGVFVIVQAFGVVRRLAAGEDVTWSRVASSLLLSLLAGALGGLVGSRLDQRRSP